MSGKTQALAWSAAMAAGVAGCWGLAVWSVINIARADLEWTKLEEVSGTDIIAGCSTCENKNKTGIYECFYADQFATPRPCNIDSCWDRTVTWFQCKETPESKKDDCDVTAQTFVKDVRNYKRKPNLDCGDVNQAYAALAGLPAKSKCVPYPDGTFNQKCVQTSCDSIIILGVVTRNGTKLCKP
jgi:hypothetical protein